MKHDLLKIPKDVKALQDKHDGLQQEIKSNKDFFNNFHEHYLHKRDELRDQLSLLRKESEHIEEVATNAKSIYKDVDQAATKYSNLSQTILTTKEQMTEEIADECQQQLDDFAKSSTAIFNSMIDDYDVTDITNRVVDQASDKIYQNLIDWIE